MNYTVVEAPAVLVTHLTEVVKSHAHELLTRQEVKNLIENLKQRLPALVEEVVPTMVKPTELQKVLQNLLRERVPIRDLETILEACGDCSLRTKDIEVMTDYVRNALGRTICKQYVDETDKMWCITLDPTLEDVVNQHIDRGERGTTNTLPPKTAQQIVARIAERMQELTGTGRPGVVLCSPVVRSAVRKMLESAMPQVAVLAYNEIPSGVSVEAVAMAGVSG
jgi:flagellar biosynthesis protein FlhA